MLRKNQKNNTTNKKNMREIVTTMLELPKEVVLNLPLITIVGSGEMNIENYKGILEYSEERIRINTTCGIMKIEGFRLTIKQITQENMCITGKITRFEYLL